MEFKDLVELYEKYKQRYKNGAHKHISELFIEAKEVHKKDWLTHPTLRGDHEQSWRAFKGKNLEKLVVNYL